MTLEAYRQKIILGRTNPSFHPNKTFMSELTVRRAKPKGPNSR